MAAWGYEFYLLVLKVSLTRPKNYLRQNIAFSYSEMIRVSFSLFLVFFFVCFCFSLLFYFIINVYKNYFINFFFMKIISIFSCSVMFQDVPACSSGMFRVPGFIDAQRRDISSQSQPLSSRVNIQRIFHGSAGIYEFYLFSVRYFRKMPVTKML